MRWVWNHGNNRYNGYRCLKRLISKYWRIVYVSCTIVVFSYLMVLLYVYSNFSLIIEQPNVPVNTTIRAMLIPYNFTDARILLSPSFQRCPNVSVFYIIRTHPRNLRWRSIVRSTWAASLKNSLVFVLGVERIGEMTEMVQAEGKIYDDLIVFDMIDTYSNMTLKSLNILRWIERSCQAPRFFIQGDPDIIAFPDEIASYTSTLDANFIAVYGKCWKGAKARREDSSKWALSPLVYASVTYPTYLAGGAWLFTPATAIRLLMALEKPLFYIHIDDMLISGIFAELMNVQRICLDTIGYLYEFEPLEQCRSDQILAVLQLEECEILKTILNHREAAIKCHSKFSYLRDKAYVNKLKLSLI